MPARFEPFWSDRLSPSRRVVFPPQRGETTADVVIVGGGLAGAICAYACAAARMSVIVLEADRIGSGASGGGSGLIREDFGTSFSDTAGAHGLRTARALWQAMRRAALDFPAALRRLGITCDLAAQDLLWFAPPDSVAAKDLRREYDARRAAGLEHRWMAPASVSRATALATGGAIRTRGAAIDPYRACIGFARAAAERGAMVFERSEARRIRSTRDGVEVVTAGGLVRGGRAVIAGGATLSDLRPLRRHLHPRHGYCVVTEPLPAPVRRELGSRTIALRDGNTPPHLVRWLKDDRVLVEGGDQDAVPARSQSRALVQRTGQLMYELSLLYPAISGAEAEWGWSWAFDDTVDGLPYVGPHRSFPRHLFALGLARHGAGAAWLAARILFRHLNGEAVKADEAFGFSRIF
jgi:glycine/D-amino acid oxidase-like deaminating enzyme